ncbi:uncharacterized protein LOC112592846 [Melanaphis sacchari]|uniref:uncharacterized protein LOC112592846 n=1 Tax=Melanaphis sacchari TaxID=742174 RepID=UPI000DC14563|nr:uncharacterized protein LOC112592846 [Melanaphis sacchari]
MWSVVCFTEDNTVAAVPKFWYRDGYCAWPNRSFQKYIDRRVNPNELEFTHFKAKVLHTDIANLLEARSVAQDNSGISSNENPDVNTNLKRIRKPKSVYKANEPVNYPSPPGHISEESEDLFNINDNSDKDKSYTMARNESVSSSDESSNCIFNDTTLKSKLNVETPQFKQHKKTSTEGTSEISGTANKKLKIFHHNISTNSTHQSTTPEVPTTKISTSTSTILSPSIELESDKAFKKFVTRSLTNIKYEIESIQKRQDSFRELLESYFEKLSNPSTHHSSIWDSDVFHEIICIENDNQLELMEEKLTTDKSYKNQVIVTLNRLVGDSLSETIRKIMQKLFSDKFLSNYSYIGFKGKHQFSTLQCCSLIFESVNKMKKFRDTPLKEIKKPIELWLAQAPSRLKKQAAKNICSTSGHL